MTFANWIRIALVVEGLALSGAAVYAVTVWAWPWPTAVALVLALSVSARVGIVVLSNGIASLGHPVRPALGWVGWLRMLAQECWAMMQDGFYRLPFEAQACKHEALTRSWPGEPIILVHGYFCNRGMLAPLLDRLIEWRLGPVYSYSYPAISAGINEVVPHLRAVIDRALQETGAQRVRIVAHSMGGLVAVAAYMTGDAPRVARIVAIASPFLGTHLARLGVGQNGRHMRIGSPYGTATRAWAESQSALLVVSIYTTHDNLVSPYTSSELPGAKSIALAGVNHIAILADPRLHAVLKEQLTN
jgi:pimeloyl-ACP methyl ester carboxylesterase